MHLLSEQLATSVKVGARKVRGGAPDDVLPPPRGRAGRALELWLRRVDLADPGWDLDSAAALLSEPERRRAGRGVPSVARRRILLRAALRGLLGDVLGVHPTAVPLSSRPGRPGLEGSAGRRGLDLSCSASGDVGLVTAVRGGRVGIDVQRIGHEDLRTAVAEGWLAAAEQAALAALPIGERPRALTRAWVQKEAVLKGEGTGLRADPARTVTPLADHGRVRQWSVSPLDVPDGYVASLAIAPAVPAVRVRSTPALSPTALSLTAKPLTAKPLTAMALTAMPRKGKP